MNDSQTKDNIMAKIGLDKLAVEVDPTYAYHTGLSSLSVSTCSDRYDSSPYRPKSVLILTAIMKMSIIKFAGHESAVP